MYHIVEGAISMAFSIKLTDEEKRLATSYARLNSFDLLLQHNQSNIFQLVVLYYFFNF